jgi:hypothetical protein
LRVPAAGAQTSPEVRWFDPRTRSVEDRQFTAAGLASDVEMGERERLPKRG